MTNRYLPTALRRALEKTVKDARLIAEEGANDAIRRLGVADSKAPSYLTEDERDLRRRLRAHARALGDALNKFGEKQETKRLVEASAYVHWHRMLFARFLAERGLLRNPEFDAPVSLEDCRELAQAEGRTDPWSIAERYAASMLPGVFRIDDPALSIVLDPVQTQELHRLVTELNSEVFQAEDSLGWTYQFWRASEKDEVNRSGVKIGAHELPAVTQLFTEPYMVRFLLHNTLGAWWAGKVLASNPTLGQTARDENELRAACSLPDYGFDMLRFVREGDNGPWRPAAGTFPGWPTEARTITVLDPCCGSGHFLTEGLSILAALRQAEEQLSSAGAVAAVLSDNLHGLEIDGRCVQIAAFAVALSAWRIGGWQQLPLPNIAWIGAATPLSRKEFIALAGGDTELEISLSALHDLFNEAPILGSLMGSTGGNLFEMERIQKLQVFFESFIAGSRKLKPERIEGAVTARGMTYATSILFKTFELISTNVPYLGIQKHHSVLLSYIDSHFPIAKYDLATVFLERIKNWLTQGGTAATVSLGEWLYLGPYTQYRKEFLRSHDPCFVARLGWNAFSYPVRANPALLIETNDRNPIRPFSLMDCSNNKDFKSNRASLLYSSIAERNASTILGNPDSRFVVCEPDIGTSLENFAESRSGLHAGDMFQFFAQFWEIRHLGTTWEPVQTAVNAIGLFSGRDKIIKWEQESGSLFRLAESVKHLNHAAQNWRAGKPFWGKSGVIVGLMGNAACSIYSGEKFDSNSSAIVPKNNDDLPAIWEFCESGEFSRLVRQIDNSLKLAPKTLLKIPFDIDYWSSIAAEKYPNGLPEPYSEDAAQWTFHGHPANANVGAALHVALGRLCGYRWPAETGIEMRLSVDARGWIAKAAELLPCDEDGLLCVPAVAGEKPLAERLRSYLSAAFGADWCDSLERRLVAEADETLDKKTARNVSLEAWVRDRAFRQHCALFGQRPFLWHISDGLKDGFSVFVYYHRFDQANLRKLTYTLLGDWLTRAEAENNALRYEKARELQQKLERILEGEKPYDIFVRWKSLAQQPLGWNPDLDDGVRQNLRPFVIAGVLTHNLSKILKDKDRGKDVPSAPWYDAFNGVRRNDHHTTLAEKRAAREAAVERVEAAK